MGALITRALSMQSVISIILEGVRFKNQMI